MPIDLLLHSIWSKCYCTVAYYLYVFFGSHCQSTQLHAYLQHYCNNTTWLLVAMWISCYLFLFFFLLYNTIQHKIIVVAAHEVIELITIIITVWFITVTVWFMAVDVVTALQITADCVIEESEIIEYDKFLTLSFNWLHLMVQLGLIWNEDR